VGVSIGSIGKCVKDERFGMVGELGKEWLHVKLSIDGALKLLKTHTHADTYAGRYVTFEEATFSP